ncbi:MAG: hypothetical protein P8M03_02770, partial [Flavobacteriaceae bacterium]|nr:hypothetical protein [Flavobacteriaceae bacterium]
MYRLIKNTYLKFPINLSLSLKAFLPLILFFTFNFLTAQNPELEVTTFPNLTTNSGPAVVGLNDVITFKILVKNTGNIQLSTVTVTTNLTGLNSAALALSSTPVFLSASSSSPEGTLMVGEVATYTATYTFISSGVSAGGVSLAVTSTAQTLAGSPTSDLGDDGDDTDGNTTNDPNIITVGQPIARVEGTKTENYVDLDGNGAIGLGDRMEYIIKVKNTGNQTLSTADLTDVLKNNYNISLVLIEPGVTPPGTPFVVSDQGSTEGNLLVGETAEYKAVYVIDQDDVDSGGLNNCLTITAVSVVSGATITDVADDGDDSDGNSVDDCTETTITASPSIEVTKVYTVNDANNNGSNDPGDTINYSITVLNNGNVTLHGLSLNDTFKDGSAGNLSLTSGPTFVSNSASSGQGTLTVGEYATYSASYLVTVNAANTGSVSNTVLATASSPGQNNNVTDVSKDADNSDGNIVDDATITPLTLTKSLDVEKTYLVVDNGDGELGVDDVINYTIIVINTGQIALSNITVNETIKDGVGGALSLNAGVQGPSGASLATGQSITFTSSYTITSGNVGTGSVSNTAIVFGSSPGNTNDVSDQSDDGNDLDGNTVNDSTVTNFAASAAIEVTKTGILVESSGDNLPGVGDTVVFTIKVENIGNTAVGTLTLVDTFKRGDAPDNTSISLTSGPTFNSATLGSSVGNLVAGEVATYTASYTVVSADVASSTVFNSVTASATTVDGSTNVNDVSDDGNDLDGNTSTDETFVGVVQQPAIEVTKTVVVNQAGSVVAKDDVAVYTITIANTGNVSLTNVSLSDNIQGILLSSSLSLAAAPVFRSATLGSSAGSLLIGEVATYQASFTINQVAVDNNGFRNVVTGSAQGPDSTTVNDVGDDGIDNDGNVLNDPTDVVIPENPNIEAVKTWTYTDNDGTGTLTPGDRINYTITVQNKGNVTLDNVTMADDLRLISETATRSLATGPNFQSADQSSSFGILKPNETATYVANYILTQDDINNGGIKNSATVTATTPANASTSDISDDNNDTDGDITSDYTESPVTTLPGIEAMKTSVIVDNGDGVTGIGDKVAYTLIVSNTGNVTLNSVTATDTLTDMASNTLSLTNPLTFLSATKGSDSNSLLFGEAATYLATYTINQAVLDMGGLSNSVYVSGSIFSTTVTDTSDDGLDDDGNTTDDATQNILSPTLIMDVTKTAVVVDNDLDGETGVGDTIVYTISIVNSGTSSLASFTLADTLQDAAGNSLSLTNNPTTTATGTLSPGATRTYTASYTISQAAVDNGGVKNSVLVTASNLTGTQFVNDVSDDGIDGDGNTVDDKTETLISADATLEATKTFTNKDNDGDGLISVGDKVVYTITVKNTGNVTQNSIYLTDTLTDFDGAARQLDPYAWSNRIAFVSSTASSSRGSLVSGETASYTATYTVVSGDISSGGVKNSVVATSYVFPEGVQTVLASDTSDDGDDTDGNVVDDPTKSYLGILPSFEVTKTATVTDNGNGVIGVGDTINYTITVANTSSDVLQNLTFVDTLKDALGTSLSMSTGPAFVSATATSSVGNLIVGETATYSATYIITQTDVDSGGVENTITFTGNSARNPDMSEKDVKDVSDNGNDADGNTTDDPTFTLLGTDSDNDGEPDTTDIDDDNDGILDRYELCLSFSLNGNNFQNYSGSVPISTGSDYNSTNNLVSPYPNKAKLPPFSAANNDGDVWTTGQNANGVTFSPYQGQFYLELLVNQGAGNNKSYWNETSHTQGSNFDRVVAFETVYPNQTYTVSYYHKVGGRKDVNFASGANTLIQVQSMQTSYQVSQTTTPGASWGNGSYTFTTDSQTTQVAILFSPYSPGGASSAIQLDAISFTSNVTCTADIDGDGIINGLDLDSDNDGIYDVDEAGVGAYDTNGDGRIDINDASFADNDYNGANDATQTTSPTNSDGDLDIDAFELDADNDGCKDVLEAGFTDDNNDGLLGTQAPPTVNANGKVTSGSDGYTTPADSDVNSVKDFQQDTYDVGCYYPGLDAIKTYNIIDNNGNSLNDLEDEVVYTITVTNTGILPLQLTTLTDNLRSETGASISSLTLAFTSVSSTTESAVATNLFRYSNYISYYSDSRWNRYGSMGGQIQSYNNAPVNIDYYFNTNSGSSHSDVNAFFPTVGFGTTPSNDYTPSESRLYNSRVYNGYDGSTGSKLNSYMYQNIALDPNTTYTISAWISRGTSSSNSIYWDDSFNFVVWQGSSGTGNAIEYSQGFIPSSYYSQGTNAFDRVSYTFTTGATIGATSRVGYSPGYNQGYGQHIWGMQFEKGSTPSDYYIYTYSSISAAPPGYLGYFDPRSTNLPIGAVATFTTTLTLTQDVLNQANTLMNSVDLIGSYITPGGISGTVTATSDDNDDTDGNTVDDPTETPLNNTAGVSLTKTYSVSDQNANGITDVGDIITYSLNVSNTGNVSLSTLSVTDTLSNLDGDLIQASNISSMTVAGSKNYFKYSNYLIVNNNSYWKNQNSHSNQNYHWQNWNPGNLKYYFSTASGRNYSDVDNFFTTEGFGITPTDDIQAGEGYLYSGRVAGNSSYSNTTDLAVRKNNYYFQDITLEPGTTYTISGWLARGNSGSVSRYDDPFYFMYMHGTSHNVNDVVYSDPIVPSYNYDSGDVNANFQRYSFTFTTPLTLSGTSRVGFSFGYNDNYGQMYWGMQLEKGSTPGRYIYTWSNTVETPELINETVGYVKWNSGEPNNGGNYDYAIMYSSTNPYSEDNQGSSNYRHIVEFSSVVSPTPAGYENYLGELNGHTYFQDDGTQNYTNSKNQAETAGGYLFSPNTKSEWDYIGTQVNAVRPNQWHYIGVYQDTSRDDYEEPAKGWVNSDGNLVSTSQVAEFTGVANGEEATFQYTYTITQADYDAGGLSNTAIISDATSGASDTSDDGDDTDGNTVDDPTVLNVEKVVAFEVTKTASVTDNGDTINGVEDIVEYTIKVKNTGTVNLNQLVIEDILSDASSSTLSLNSSPTYVQTNKFIKGSDLNTNDYWGNSSEPNQSSTNRRYAQFRVNSVGNEGFWDEYNYNQSIRYIVESSIATTTFNAGSGYVYFGSHNGHYYYTSGSTADYATAKSNSTTAYSTILIINNDAEFQFIKGKRADLAAIYNGYYWLGLEQDHSASDYAHPRGGWYWADGTPLSKSGQVSVTTVAATTTININEEFTYTASYTITQQDVDTGLISNIVSSTAVSISSITVTDTSDDRSCGTGDYVSSYWTSSHPSSTSGYEYAGLYRNDGKIISMPNGSAEHILEMNSASVTPTGYVFGGSYGGHGYYYYSGELTWEGAKIKAKASGGYLLVINSTAELNYITSMKNNLTNPSDSAQSSWIGLKQDEFSCSYSEPSGGWFWVDTSDNKDPSNTVLDNSPLMEVTKTATVSDVNVNGLNDAGDIIVYTITVENKGNVTISTPTFNEYLIDGEGTNLTSSLVGPTYTSKTFSPTIKEIQVTVAAGSGGGNKYFLNGIEAKDVVFQRGYTYRFFQSEASNSGHLLKLSTVDDGTNGGGSAYTTNVTETGTPGNAGAYTEIKITDTTPALFYYCSNHAGMGGNTVFLPGAAIVPKILRPFETETYTATYTIGGASGGTAFISNTVSVTGSTFGQTNNVSDTSDDGDDTDGNTVDDETRVDLSPIASFEVTKTGTKTIDDGDGLLGPGDTITYTYVVSNTGNLKIEGITLTDTMIDGYGNSISLSTGPTFVSASLGSTSGTIELSEIASYTGTYVLPQQTVNSGLVSNSLYVAGSTYGFTNNVTDTSDDGDDTDGNTVDDPLVIPIPEVLDLEVTKTAIVNDLNQDGITNLGDQIQYTFTINNKGNTSINTLTFIDNLLDFSGSTVTNTILTIPEGQNLFGRSNAIDDTDNVWNETAAGGDRNCSQAECLDIPKGIPYYYGSPSGSTFNADLQTVFPNTGFGTTSQAGNASASNGMRASRLWSLSDTSFVYQDITFDANTDYTISIYAKATTGPFNDPMHFVVWDGTGSFDVAEVDDSYKSAPYYLTNQWKRYTYTFKTGSGGAGRVGFHPPVQSQNNIFWGAQLEKLDKATPYIHTYDSKPIRNISQLQDNVQILNSGDTITMDGYFNISQDAVNSGGVSNTLIVSATSVRSSSVSDTSDDGDDTDGNTTDDVTFTEITSVPSIEVTKIATVADTNSNTKVDLGDIITYTINVSNTGNTAITGISFADVITTSLGAQLSLNAPPARIFTSNGSDVGTLKVGEYATYIALFTINATAFAAEKLSNTATVTANAGGQTGNVSDTSDDGDDTDGNTTDDPTETTMEPTPGIEVTKTAILNDDNGNSTTDVGDSIKFIIIIENTGNTNLSSLTFVDTLVDKTNSSLSLTNGPYFVSATQSSTVGNLKLQETATYHAFFTINTQAINAGSVKNSVLATASSPGNSNNVTDTSDDGDDTDGNTTDDVTEVQVTSGGSINVTKVSSVFDNGDGITGAGDTINYVIKIVNTGTASLTSLTVSDTLTNNNGGVLALSNGPSFVSATQSSTVGTIKPAEIVTYSAAYVIQQSAAETGGIKNSVTVTGSSPGNSNDVTDVSDDADDTDGNTVDDQTIVGISLLPVLEVTKTSTITDNNSNNLIDLGDAIVYNITVQNKGNVIITGVSISDIIKDGNGSPLSLIATPTFISSSASSAQGTLTVNETATYSATIIINQQAVDSGSISNTVSSTGSSPGNSNDVSDLSDDGDDTDGNTSNDPTVVSITNSPSIEVTKTSSVTDNNGNGEADLGDVITYSITVQNKGNVTLNGVSITDTLVDGNSSALTLASGPTYNSSNASSTQGTLTINEIATYTATYTINQQAVDSGSVSNTVLVTAS